MTRRKLAAGRAENPDVDHWRPATRAECEGGCRPCPYVGCAWNLYLDVNPHTGSIKLNFPDLEPHEMSESCALDVADRGGITLDEAGGIMNLTRERIRQVETRALAKVEPELGLALEMSNEESVRGERHPRGARRLPLVVHQGGRARCGDDRDPQGA